MKRVLFVCLGNICRSPTAEGLMRSMVSKDDSVETDSAGTGAYHIGNPPDSRAIAEASRRGIDISDLRARQVERADFDRFDLILAMDRSNLADLQEMAPKGCHAEVSLMLKNADVPDPYYEDGFDTVYDLLENVIQDLLAGLQLSNV